MASKDAFESVADIFGQLAKWVNRNKRSSALHHPSPGIIVVVAID